MTDNVLYTYVVRLADDAIILSQRLSEWCGHASHIEEDVALSNIALDLIGQARILYSHAAGLEGKGRTEDDICFFRVERQYTNCLLVEQPNADFAVTITRQLFFSAFMLPFWTALKSSNDDVLSGLAAKAEKEVAYHLRHSSEWFIRLGDGTPESHSRIEAAVDDLWMYTGELFDLDEITNGLVKRGLAIDPETLRSEWNETINAVLARATISRPDECWMQIGGRSGEHTEHLGHLLSPMQYLQRSYPGETW